MTKVVITREEAEAFIKEQLSSKTDTKKKHIRPDEYNLSRVHYGRCELKDLLDAIYGEITEQFERTFSADVSGE